MLSAGNLQTKGLAGQQLHSQAVERRPETIDGQLFVSWLKYQGEANE